MTYGLIPRRPFEGGESDIPEDLLVANPNHPIDSDSDSQESGDESDGSMQS